MQYQEKHIEKAFITAMKTGISGFHFEFLGQQIPCSAGIIDVMALLRQGFPNSYVDYLWVCEIKRGKAPDSAVAQVLAYSHLIQWFLHDRYPAMEGVSASQAEHNLYPWPVIVAEGLGKMGEKAHFSGVIQFVRYTYHGDDNFSFEYMRDMTTEYRPPRLEIDLEPFLGNSLKRLYNDPSNWGLFHDRQLQEPVFSLPSIWKETIKG